MAKSKSFLTPRTQYKEIVKELVQLILELVSRLRDELPHTKVTLSKRDKC